MEAMKYFVEGVIAVFGERYQRRPTMEDVEHLATQDWREMRFSWYVWHYGFYALAMEEMSNYMEGPIHSG